jgi:hypothetical protein
MRPDFRWCESCQGRAWQLNLRHGETVADMHNLPLQTADRTPSPISGAAATTPTTFTTYPGPSPFIHLESSLGLAPMASILISPANSAQLNPGLRSSSLSPPSNLPPVPHFDCRIPFSLDTRNQLSCDAAQQPSASLHRRISI